MSLISHVFTHFATMGQLPDSMKQSQADLYLETYQVLDLEMSRLREIQRWQASASSKVWNALYILYDTFSFFQKLSHTQT